MKNWTEDGTIHYNAATDRSYTIVNLCFEHLGRRRKFPLLIPQEMRPAFKGEHFDQAIITAKKTLDDQALRCMFNGDFNPDSIAAVSEPLALVAMLQQLYNEFHLHQARVGNDVWATPKLMDDVGPPPEDDAKYFQ
jgi:hypothetical protein